MNYATSFPIPAWERTDGRSWGLLLTMLAMLFCVGRAAAQDLEVTSVVATATSINIDATTTVVVTFSDDDASGMDVLLDINVPTTLNITDAAAVIGGAGAGTVSFSKLNNQHAQITGTGLDGADHTVTFTIEGVAIVDDALIEVTALASGTDAEAGDAVEPNFAVETVDVSAPELTAAIAETGGPTPFPATFSTGDAVTIEITVTNNAPGATDTSDDADLIQVNVSVPGVTIDLTSIGSDCTGGINVTGGTCSFDPVSGIWLISDPILTGSDTRTLTFDGTIFDTNYAGPWAAHIASVDPIDADESNHLTTVGVTINSAPVWSKLSQGPFEGTVAALHFDDAFGDDGRLFGGTDGDGIFFSKDNGANWCEDIASGLIPRGFVRGVTTVARPASLNGRRLVAGTFDVGTGDGIYLSDDGGETWIDPTTSPEDVNAGDDQQVMSLISFITVDPGNDLTSAAGDEVLIAGLANGKIYFSDDAGAQWAEVTDSGVFSTRILALVHFTGTGAHVGEDIVLAGTDTNGILFSSDGGDEFDDTSSSDLDDVIIFDLAYNADNATVYAATSRGTTGATLYSSTNNGKVYTAASFGTGVTAPVMRSVIAYRDGGLDYVIAGGDGADLYVSSDGGASFTRTTLGFPNLTIYDLVRDDDGNVYAATGNGGVWRSDNNGLTWTQSQIALPAILITDLDTDHSGNVTPGPGIQDGDLVAASFGAGVFHYDESCGWERLAHAAGGTGLPSDFVSTIAISPTTNSYFVGTWANSIYRSTNQGGTWVTSGLPNLPVYDLGIFTNADGRELVLAGANLGQIFRTVDDGFQWHQFAVGNAMIQAVGGAAYGAGDVYLAGTNGAGVLRSLDEGDTWTQTGLATGHITDFVDNTTALFASSYNGIYTSTNTSTAAGASWTALTAPEVANQQVQALAADGTKLYAALRAGGVLESTDGGGTWAAVSGLPASIQVQAFMTRIVQDGEDEQGDPLFFHEMYAVTTTGDAYTQRRRTSAPAAQDNGGTNVDNEDLGELPGEFNLEQNYPNPFNPATTIRFDLPEASDVRLTVYDMLGRQVKVLAQGTHAAGTYEVAFDGSGLASGMYLYRLETPTQAIVRKMLLLK